MTPGPGGLAPILADVRRRAELRRRALPLQDLRQEAQPDAGRRARFVAALEVPGLRLIAECKRRSPSAGPLGSGSGLAARLAAYARGGADALSILTEEDHFGGSPEDLRTALRAGLPCLRKDFLLDEGMVLESLLWGADAVLLIAACLPGSLLGELRAAAGEAGLAVLMEVHGEAELERALGTAPDCLGVNARDLRSFQVDLGAVERLLPRVPDGPLKVAESGIRSLADLERVRSAGADAALVGEALMRAPDPHALLGSWRSSLDEAET